jgi:hypothetical protein
MLYGLSDQVRAWITDGGGDPVEGAPDPGDVRTVNFQPQGGEAYWLNLAFGPSWEADAVTWTAIALAESGGEAADDNGPSENFGIALFCESRDDQERWTPTPTMTRTPTPRPSSTPTITPTPTPTIYRRPTFTPTQRFIIILPTATR